MILSILIPTYNRAEFLKKNIELLYHHIIKGNLENEIEILISNNYSSDNTHELVNNFIKSNRVIQIRYYLQEKNLGLERNALFVLGVAKGDYVMFLGDDDFIEFEYLVLSLDHLKKHPLTSCVVPNYIPVDIKGIKIGPGRDDTCTDSLTKAGFSNCLKNSWRGHQLSGLFFRREGLYDIYRERKVSNIYLFIFFVSISCLKGDTYHFTKFPVKVTQPGQEKKDWNYGKDGLLNEVFDNYRKLPVNFFRQTILQIDFFKRQSWRLWMFKRINNYDFFQAFFKILISKNSTLGFKLWFPIFVSLRYLKNIIKKMLIS